MYDKLPSLRLFPHDRSDNIIIATIYDHRSFPSVSTRVQKDFSMILKLGARIIS